MLSHDTLMIALTLAIMVQMWYELISGGELLPVTKVTKCGGFKPRVLSNISHLQKSGDRRGVEGSVILIHYTRK